MPLDLPNGSADVVVALEVLSPVWGQEEFITKSSGLLRPNGYLMLAIRNLLVLQRMAGVAAIPPGQNRPWANARQLKTLLRLRFDPLELTSALSVRNQGVLSLINSSGLNAFLSKFVSQRDIDSLKEYFHLGHTLMALARKRK